MKEKKDKLITLLSILLLIFTISFAMIYNNYEASSNYAIAHDSWSINVSSASVESKTETAFNIDVDVSATTTIANFTMINPEDEITYNINVVNSGTMDAKLESVLVVGNSENVTYEISKDAVGHVLTAGGTQNIRVTFKSNVKEATAIQEEVAIILNYK